MGHSCTIGFKANNNGSYIIWNESQLITLAGNFIQNFFVQAGLLHPVQLAYVLRIIHGAGNIQDWALHMNNKLIANSDQQPEANGPQSNSLNSFTPLMTEDQSMHDLNYSTGNSFPYVPVVPDNNVQTNEPTETDASSLSEVFIDFDKALADMEAGGFAILPAGQAQDQMANLDAEAAPSNEPMTDAYETTQEAGASYPTPLADSPPKKRRRTCSAPLLPSGESSAGLWSEFNNNSSETEAPTNSYSSVFSILKSLPFVEEKEKEKEKKKKKKRRKGERKEANKDANKGPNRIQDEEKIPLSDQKLEQALEIGLGFTNRNACSMLSDRLDLDSLRYNESLGLHALGLPTPFIGIEVMANYATLIDSKSLDPVRDRFARMILALNYRELCSHPEKYCSRARQSQEKTATLVLDCIAGFYKNPKFKTQGGLRTAISGHARWGRYFWSIAGTAGFDVILTCDDKTMKKMSNYSFGNAQMDALTTYARYTRPATNPSLESMVKSLLLGKVTEPLAEIIQGSTSGCLVLAESSQVDTEDQSALTHNWTENQWVPVCAESIAVEEMDKLLGDSSVRKDIGI
ncbi:hypothetical protein RU639_013525 [Aspergillus parasiticus]